MITKLASIDKLSTAEKDNLLESSELAHDRILRAGKGIFVIQDGKLKYVNHLFRELIGYSNEELIDELFINFVHLDDRGLVKESETERLRQNSLLPYEYRLVKKNGELVWVAGKVISAEYNDENTVIGIFTDITPYKLAEEQREALLVELQEVNHKLGQSNRELQDFAYIASHDLREPLRKIVSFGALLQDTINDRLDEDEQENLAFMIDGANRMQAMIDDLLIYSRVTTRAKPSERVDLNEVLDNLRSLELASRLDDTKGTIHTPVPLPVVQAETSQMHQLFQNLIGNGLKFHREGVSPEITIDTYPADNNMVRVEISDNGIGIAPEYHEQIFTMFKRLHSRVDYDGTGIGLAICKKIVNRHGGDIGIRSTPGEGATFWFTLPNFNASAKN